MESHSLVESDDVREQGVPQERIKVWTRSKAGHLGEMTKIFVRLDEGLSLYKRSNGAESSFKGSMGALLFCVQLTMKL